MMLAILVAARDYSPMHREPPRPNCFSDCHGMSSITFWPLMLFALTTDNTVCLFFEVSNWLKKEANPL